MGTVKKALMSDKMASAYPSAASIMRMGSRRKSELVYSIVERFCKETGFVPADGEDIRWAISCIKRDRLDLLNSPRGGGGEDLERMKYEQFVLYARADGSVLKDISFEEWKGLSNGGPVKEKINSETSFSSLPVSQSSKPQEREQNKTTQTEDSAEPVSKTEAVAINVAESEPSFEPVKRAEEDGTKAKTQALMHMFDDDDDDDGQ